MAALPDDSGDLIDDIYYKLFNYMRNGVAVYKPVDDGEDFVFVDLNQAAEEIDGVKRSELVGKRLSEVFPGVSSFGLLNVLKRVYRTGESEYLPRSF